MEGNKKISKELQEESKTYRKSLYAANVELEKYIKKRNAMVFVLFALTLLDFVWKIIVICQKGIYEEILYESIRLLFFAFIFFLVSRPFKGKYLLWLLVVGNLMAVPTYVETFPNIGLYWESSPAFVLMYITELIYILCLVFVAAWLTLSGKNRRYDEQAGEIEKKYSEYIVERMK